MSCLSGASTVAWVLPARAFRCFGFVFVLTTSMLLCVLAVGRGGLRELTDVGRILATRARSMANSSWMPSTSTLVDLFGLGGNDLFGLDRAMTSWASWAIELFG